MELTLINVNKVFAGKKAVNDVLLKIGYGIHGLLGANGAGKTTLMKMICGILEPTSGEIMLNGQNTKKLGEEYLELLGYLPQNSGYYPEFTGMEYVDFIGTVKGLPKGIIKKRANELFELFQLFDMKNKKIKTYSGGMKQRLGLIQAMLNEPRILILDEPTAGLDPKQRLVFKNYLSHISKDRIIILSTHITSDIQDIADDIIIMKSGKIICKSDEETLLNQLIGKVWEFPVDDIELLANTENFPVIRYYRNGNKTKVRVFSETSPAEDAHLEEPNLEDLYLYYNPEQLQG